MPDYPGVTDDGFMILFQKFLRRRTELVCEEVERDRVSMGEIDPFDASVIRAYWTKWMNVAVATTPKKPVTEEEKLSLFAQIYAEQLGLPSSELPNDVEARLSWAKKRIGNALDREIRAAVDLHDITSPVEAIFLIEWKTMQVGERYELRLHPQRPVRTDRGDYEVDFFVSSLANPGLKLAIELDGHDFHEKTKAQATSDRARERAIMREGVTVLRFTGAEVHRNPHACVLEVLQHAGCVPRS